MYRKVHATMPGIVEVEEPGYAKQAACAATHAPGMP